MWLPSNKSTLGFINFLLYCMQLGLMIYNFFCCIFQGPGFVPLGNCRLNAKTKMIQLRPHEPILTPLSFCDRLET